MPQIKDLLVQDLKLDLHNFRTVPQTSEEDALHAIIQIEPDYFWALAHSLADEGYQPTENIIVLKSGDKGQALTVMEGNRRIGAMKLILGHIPSAAFGVPVDLVEKIAKLTQEWKSQNSSVPCALYDLAEAKKVDLIVALTHGKGEKAGRLPWPAVARARHNRDEGGASEPALDLLEKYLTSTKSLSADQKERWSGDYPLSVLEEVLKKVAPRIGAATSRDVVDQYPAKTKFRKAIDDLIADIGHKNLDFPAVRKVGEDFAANYGIPAPVVQPTASSNQGSTNSAAAASAGSTQNSPQGGSPGATTPSASPQPAATAKPTRGIKAAASNDPKSVSRALRKFAPKGNGREKLVTLLNEAKTLKIDTHPHAFCFLLRSMFELSAKAYCADHKKDGLTPLQKDGRDKDLAQVLKEITSHLTKNGQDKAAQRELHGPVAELNKPSGFLSVTSLNQLVHNRRFTVDGTHISTLFHNVFPLLEAMNR